MRPGIAVEQGYLGGTYIVSEVSAHLMSRYSTIVPYMIETRLDEGFIYTLLFIVCCVTRTPGTHMHNRYIYRY